MEWVDVSRGISRICIVVYYSFVIEMHKLWWEIVYTNSHKYWQFYEKQPKMSTITRRIAVEWAAMILKNGVYQTMNGHQICSIAV